MKERTFNCPDCGVEVKTPYSRTLRCRECTRKHNLEYRKQWHKENDHLRNRKKRKSDAIGDPETTHFCDLQENIQKCLNCERPKCGNCLGTTGARERYMRKKEMLKNAKNGNQSTTVCAGP